MYIVCLNCSVSYLYKEILGFFISEGHWSACRLTSLPVNNWRSGIVLCTCRLRGLFTPKHISTVALKHGWAWSSTEEDFYQSAPSSRSRHPTPLPGGCCDARIGKSCSKWSEQQGRENPERHPGFGGRRRNGAMIDVSWAIPQPSTSSSDEEGEEDEGEACT